jgi:hypothetical protein
LTRFHQQQHVLDIYGTLVAMRVHPISNDCHSEIPLRSHLTSQLKPPLHTHHLQHRRHENECNEIMDTASPKDVCVTDIRLGSTDKSDSQQPDTVNGFVYEHEDDFMTRIVDGTCRGIFPMSDNIDDDHDKHSLCHLPSCHLSENLNMFMVCG